MMGWDGMEWDGMANNTSIHIYTLLSLSLSFSLVDISLLDVFPLEPSPPLHVGEKSLLTERPKNAMIRMLIVEHRHLTRPFHAGSSYPLNCFLGPGGTISLD